MGSQLPQTRSALAESLESRRLMSVQPASPSASPPEANAPPALHVRARPNLNFVGNYLGNVNVKGLGTVSFHLELDVFDTSSKFILGSVTFIPAGRTPFDGTYKINGPTFTFTTRKLANSLTLTGKLVKLGSTLTGKFTLVENGTAYSGKYILTRQ